MNTAPQTRVYLTLTNVLVTGIVEASGEITGDTFHAPGSGYVHGEGVCWHRTRSAANTRAREIRKAHVETLRNEIERINALDFGATSGGFRG